jgi:dihydroflavonol-4-reductase
LNLVTGATGLIGSHVMLNLLRQNRPVVALKRSSSNISKTEKVFSFYNAKNLFQKITWVEGDICDVLSLEEALKNIETVYHCAGFISFNDKDHDKLFRINIEGTANIVNACLTKGVKAFCHVSSVASLNNADIKTEIDETVFWKAGKYQSSYSISKYLAEQEAWRGIEEGLNSVIVNPGVVIGPGPWDQGSGELFPLCHKGFKFYTDGVTGYVGADDVAKAMIKLVDEKIFGERFILVENNYSFKQIFDWIHAEFKQKTPSIKVGSALLHLARACNSVIPFSKKITRATVNASLSKTYFSNQKVTKTLKFQFSPLKDCISLTCKAYFS